MLFCLACVLRHCASARKCTEATGGEQGGAWPHRGGAWPRSGDPEFSPNQERSDTGKEDPASGAQKALKETKDIFFCRLYFLSSSPDVRFLIQTSSWKNPQFVVGLGCGQLSRGGFRALFPPPPPLGSSSARDFFGPVLLGKRKKGAHRTKRHSNKTKISEESEARVPEKCLLRVIVSRTDSRTAAGLACAWKALLN